MASTSGTVATTVVEVADVLDAAVARCGVRPEQMTPEMVAMLLRNLDFILKRLTNKGAVLWAVERRFLSLRTDKTDYDLAPGTVAVLNATYREPQRLIAYGGADAETFPAATPVSIVGMKPSASASASAAVAFEVSDDGLTWTSVGDPGTVDFVAGEWSWFSVDPAPSALMFRTVTTPSVALEDRLLANAGVEIPLYQLARDKYAVLPDKRSPGQPLQFLLDRQTTPRMLLWPMPRTAQAHVIYWRQRQVQDVGALTNRLEMRDQWLDAVTYRLAEQSILEIPGADLQRQPLLERKAQVLDDEASDDESDRAPRTMHPVIRGYTR